MRGYAVLAGLALLAAASHRRARQRSLPGPRALARNPEAIALPPHVGLEDYEWPRSDLFPDRESFIEALRRLGYSAPDAPDPAAPEGRALISQWQLDFNVLARARGWSTYPSSCRRDGLLDDEAVDCLARSLEHHKSEHDWLVSVEDAIDDLRPEVG